MFKLQGGGGGGVFASCFFFKKNADHGVNNGTMNCLLNYCHFQAIIEKTAATVKHDDLLWFIKLIRT